MHPESDEFEKADAMPEAGEAEPAEASTSEVQAPEAESAEDGAIEAQASEVESAEEGNLEAQSSEGSPPAEESSVAIEGDVELQDEVVEQQPAVEQAEGETAAPAETGESLEAPESGEPSPDQPAWYVVHCYSGYENKVRHNLEQRIETMGMKDKIFEVVIPTQEEIEVREGKRRTVERHIFPGYVLVSMILTEESWYVVRNTPGVTGFVGMGTSPTPLRPEEVNQIIKRMEAEAPRVKVSFKEGERVRIIDGPFNDFRGTVAEIDMERTKVRVMVSMFGRETPVELDFLQVEKA
jgi:transcriptional antiterminator NusG